MFMVLRVFAFLNSYESLQINNSEPLKESKQGESGKATVNESLCQGCKVSSMRKQNRP